MPNKEPDFPFNPEDELRRLVGDDPRRKAFEYLLDLVTTQHLDLVGLKERIEKLEIPDGLPRTGDI
jgi:hypothetical protein